MNGELEPIDLMPYINGERKIMNICYVCKQRKDMTKDFIMIETENNLRKQDPNYNPSCDELVFYGWTCEDCKLKERKV